MIRFAATVTAIEIALTLAAVLLVTAIERAEPYFPQEDLARLGMPAETYSTGQRFRAGKISSYDTNAVVAGSGQAIFVSLQMETPRDEFDNLRSAELRAQADPAAGQIMIDEGRRRDEVGYAVRQLGPAGLRSELVRLRGGDMLVVRLTLVDAHRAEAPRLERLARLIQERMMHRLGWRQE